MRVQPPRIAGPARCCVSSLWRNGAQDAAETALGAHGCGSARSPLPHVIEWCLKSPVGARRDRRMASCALPTPGFRSCPSRRVLADARCRAELGRSAAQLEARRGRKRESESAPRRRLRCGGRRWGRDSGRSDARCWRASRQGEGGALWTGDVPPTRRSRRARSASGAVAEGGPGARCDRGSTVVPGPRVRGVAVASRNAESNSDGRTRLGTVDVAIG